ncbi:hypothetical protein NliqN6_1407 [Naganishia liquefaciens]|uniref:Small-subunit processome Utp12 domain-containing protein n=1 Tax=Naganishia liquefaciens TaxID=104408 RepID=A0A8H3TQZ7_9TREE|nr:hypothetical protein NliqN6_1407 [Naganishia liquefaciens]
MVRSYQRHGPTQAFGVICSPAATATFDGRTAHVPAWEDVLGWDMRRGEQVSAWHSTGVTDAVTLIRAAPSASEENGAGRVYAVAYADGSIRLWAEVGMEGAELVTFNGHRKSATALAWDAAGARLFSGGAEGEIVVWDVIGEVGLFRLKGHRGPVTAIHWLDHPSEGAHPGWLVTTSKDGLIKLWDLQLRHCVQTCVVGRGEIVSCAIREGDGAWWIVTGSGDGECKGWEIQRDELRKGLTEDESGQLQPLIHAIGPLPLSSQLTTPITYLAFHPNPAIPLLVLQPTDRSVVVLRLRSEEELEAKRARRRKREKEKREKQGDHQVAVEPEEEEPQRNGWLDRVTDWCVVRAGGKVRGLSLVESDDGSKGIQLLLSLSNNSLESYTIPTPPIANAVGSKSARQLKAASSSGQIEPVRTHVLERQGHRADVRCLSVSSDDQVLASAANGSLKIWNLKTGACIRTMECGYAICCAFLPGDRHVLVGTKSGHLELFDLASSSMLESIQAHTAAIWGMDLRADKGGLVTCSADKDVKFWDIRTKQVESGSGSRIITRLGEERVIKTSQIGLVHVKTLKMTDDVLAVKYSPDGRLLAVSLLDSTVKVFFQDTLKFFLSLYGHKLPVLAMDISSDSKLIITCSADKNVKIWGLDFGDCHKSIFAHEESIMQIAFERNSHYFWTVGKDRLIKYWDGDKFEMIQKFEGHHGEVWALAVSHFGEFVVSGSHDKSIRVWEKTDEPLFLEEERERELEQMYESNVAETLNRDTGRIGGGVEGADADADAEADEASAVTKQSAETLMAGEKIMEAIEMADADRALMRDYEDSRARTTGELKEALMPPTRNPTLIAMGNPSPEDYVRGVMEKVPPAQMEDALLVLPFKQVISLLEYLGMWAATETNIALVSRVLFFLLRTHHHQIVSNRIMRKTLQEIRLHLRTALTKQKETMGYNMAALKFIKRLHDANKTASMLEEEALDEDKVRARIEDGMKKRKRVAVRA